MQKEPIIDNEIYEICVLHERFCAGHHSAWPVEVLKPIFDARTTLELEHGMASEVLETGCRRHPSTSRVLYEYRMEVKLRPLKFREVWTPEGGVEKEDSKIIITRKADLQDPKPRTREPAQILTFVDDAEIDWSIVFLYFLASLFSAGFWVSVYMLFLYFWGS